MTDKESVLSSFLFSLKAEGEALDSGSFTLRVTGLRDRFVSLLEARTDWILKVVQAAVASDCDAIKVRLKRGATQVIFDPAQVWTSAELQSELCSTQLSTDEALNHLKVFFWSEGCGHGNRLEFTLPEEQLRLIWNGHEWEQRGLSTMGKAKGFRVKVKMASPSTLSLKNLRARAAVNSELQLTLSKRAFSCPVPLSCDGRRFDSLLHCPTHSIKDMGSHPLELTDVKTEAPNFRVPPGTFRSSFNFGLHGLPVKLQLFYRAWRKTLKPFSDASLVRLLCLYLHEVDSGMVLGQSRSCFYFIKDGVVVGTVAVGGARSVSYACFLSAADLALDLSTLKLNETPAQRLRLELARTQLSKMKWECPSLEVLQDSSRVKNGLFGLAGFASGIFGQVLIEASMGFVTFGVGTVLAAIMMACFRRMWLSPKEAEEYFQQVQADLKALKGELESPLDRESAIPRTSCPS